MRIFPHLVTLAVLPLVTASARAQAPEPSKVRMAWDRSYLYAAFTITDPNVRGTNDKPFSSPLEDDAVGLYVRVGKGAPGKPDAATDALLVSAAGGGALLQGAGGVYVPRRAFSMKYGAKVLGTINQPSDIDKGYSVELALPWSLLGIDGKTVTTETFVSGCVLTRRRGGALIPFPAGADVNEPSSWPRILLSDSAGAAPGATSPLTALAAAQPPTIDGAVGAGEWPAAFATLPTADEPPPSAIESDVPIPLLPLPGVKTAAPNLAGKEWSNLRGRVFARYLPYYQADLGKAYPVRGILNERGDYLFTDQPASGLGPWFSTDRVGWHRGELSAMRRAGIESALVQMGGPDAPTALLDDKTTLTMVAALRELAEERQLAPQVAPLFDTGFLAAGPMDLATTAGRDPLWRAVRRWMTLVPPEFRCRVPLPGGGSAYPIFLSDGTRLPGNGAPGWADDLRARFAKEFGGSGNTLLFVGGRGFDLSDNIAGALPLGSGRGRGALSLSVVQPGSQFPLVPRKTGATYRTSWDSAIDAGSSWLILDSWNDYAAATEIAPTRQYGGDYVDETKVQLVRALSNRPWGVRLLGADVPPLLKSGELFPALVTIQSTGLTPLRGPSAPVLSYRWLQGGKAVAQGPVPIRPGVTLLATQAASVRLGIATMQLKPGDYILEIDAKDPDGKPADALSMPVRVEAMRPDALEISRTTTTPLLQSGATYPTTLTLRWLGDAPLAPGDARLVCQVLSADGRKVLRSDSAPLDVTLSPGVWTTVRASVRTVSASGAPLPPAMPEIAPRDYDENALTCRIRWTLVRGEAPVPGGYEESVAIYPGDDEARVRLDSLPETGDAGDAVEATATIANRGQFPWARGQYALALRWAYADGFTFRKQEEGHVRTPIAPPSMGLAFPRDVMPGESFSATIPVRLPDREGRYIAVLSVVRLSAQGTTYLDGGVVTRSGDIAASVVTVSGGRLVPLDIKKYFDIDGVSSEDTPADGDLDGKGATLPAEWLAPDRFGLNRPLSAGSKRPAPTPVYPSGYYAEISSTAARGAGFRYGPTTLGAKNAIGAHGQSISIPRGRYYALHVAALATGGDAPLTLTLKYADGTTEERKIVVSDWLKAPGPQDAVALSTPRKRTPQTDTAETASIRHYVVGVGAQKDLVEIRLGAEPKVKIFALTLER